MRATQVLDHLVAETAKPVAVRHDQAFNPPMNNGVKDSQEVPAAKIEANADFLDPFVYGPSVCRTELFQDSDLIVWVGLLSLRLQGALVFGG